MTTSNMCHTYRFKKKKEKEILCQSVLYETTCILYLNLFAIENRHILSHGVNES